MKIIYNLLFIISISELHYHWIDVDIFIVLAIINPYCKYTIEHYHPELVSYNLQEWIPYNWC